MSRIVAYGMETITGPVSTLNNMVIKELFPYFDPCHLQRKSSSVDVLLGNDYYGLHPKREIAKNGDHLSIMEGELGVCLQGNHPRLAELTEMTTIVAEMHNVIGVETCSNFRHAKVGSEEIGSYICHSKREYPGVNSFISGQKLGTQIFPKCEKRKCFKCPVLGHTHSFREQQETDTIKKDFKKRKKLISSKSRISKCWKALDNNAFHKEGTTQGPQWIFGPADSPWHQGAVDSLVKAAKKCFKMTMGIQRLSPTRILTLSAEVSNMLNERPQGVLPSSDSEINILITNNLLLGRSLSINPGGWSNNPYKNQLGLITEMANRFWKHWTELYVPTLIKQTKWHRPDQNLKVDDIVAVADHNSLRGKYHIAKVADVFPGKDGKVRR